MLFVDQAQILVKAGDGGRGCRAFAQPPYTRHPYPDGGNGGDGGHVIIRTDLNVATLLDFQFRHEFAAGRGGHGGANKKTGKRGEECVIRVPVGTVLHDADGGEVLRDLAAPGEEVLMVSGGRGGIGNAYAPHALPGGPGETRRLRLELKLIADAGLIGIPNAGKSSLLSRISTARPKIAAYPFTTRYPVLGVAQVPGRGSFVACDIPGLIEGAHEGKGLGMQFLRHIERTRLLVHLVDMAAVDGREPMEAYRQVNEELAAYSPTLRAKPQLVVANKIDLPEATARLEEFRRTLGPEIGRVWAISCVTGVGIPELLHGMADALEALR